MIAGVAGLIGIALCPFVASAVERSEGGKVAGLLLAIIVCFGVSIFGVAKETVSYGCDDYSRFASSC